MMTAIILKFNGFMNTCRIRVINIIIFNPQHRVITLVETDA